MIALSCGIKISAVHCLVLSQSTRVMDGQNYDSQHHASIAASRWLKRDGKRSVNMMERLFRYR